MGKPIKWFSINRTLSEDNEEGTLQTTGDFLMNKACELRGKYPNALRGGGMLQAVMDDACYNRGFNIPGSPTENEYTGGQCITRYGVEYSVFFNGQEFRRIYNGIFGPVGNFFQSEAGGLFVDERNPDSSTGARRDRAIDTGGSYDDNYTIHRVFRLDSEADNCGNLGDIPDPPIDPDDFSITVSIPGTPGDLGDQREVDVAVDIDTELTPDGEHCFLIDGRRYCITPDGVEEEEAEEEEEIEEEEIEVLDKLLITVSEPPISFNKKIVRPNAKDSEIFAGYIAWSYVRNGNEYFYPAIPIRKARNVFDPPEGTETYSVYSNYNLTLSVVEVKKIIKVPVTPQSGDTIA